MPRNDFARAEQLASSMLVMDNPDDVELENRIDAASEKLQQLALTLGSEDINIGSLTEMQWRQHIADMGFDPDDVTPLFEGLVSWSQTDDVED